MLAATDKEAKERCMEAYREEKRKVKSYIYQSKKKVNEQLGKKMNQNVNENRKLFWKKVNKAKEGKVESCSSIKDGKGKLVHGEVEVRRT